MVVIDCEPLKAGDYTFYMPYEDIQRCCEDSKTRFDMSSEVGMTVSKEVAGERGAIDGRALLASCFWKTRCSITLRRNKNSDAGSISQYRIGDVNWAESCDYMPSKELPGGCGVSTAALCEVLYDRVFQDLKPPYRGLLVVSGSTKAAKSSVLRGLALKRLIQIQSLNPERRPHIVTLEDPIEVQLNRESVNAQFHSGIDYTPREIGTDVLNIATGLKDALRQTPAILYIREVRKEDDWLPIIDFAGSGHLVMATTHSGSLTETIERILSAFGASHASERGYVTQRILAVIHHEVIEIKNRIVILPAIWRRTSASVALMASEGLSSILPHNPGFASTWQVSALGRQWFARHFCSEERAGKPGVKVLDIEQHIVKEAALRDLMGL